MSRSIGSGWTRYCWGALLLACALLVLPQASVAAEPGEETPPEITNGILSPGILTYEGGEVSVGADVTAAAVVVDVFAEFIGSDGSYRSVALAPIGGSSYSGSVGIPPNFSEGEISYSVYVSASDLGGLLNAVLIGEIQVLAPPQFDEAPIVSEPSLQPSPLPAEGGPVTIRATASDNRSVSAVYATVELPGGGSTEVPLEPVSSSRFEGVFTAPPNVAPSPLQYPVTITAEDDIGQPGSVAAGSIVVAGRPVTSAGLLAIRPVARNFGRARVGRRTWRLIRVRNTGPRSSKPVEAVIQASGGEFTLPWAPADGISFRLRPHETRIFAVEFRPAQAGLRTGAVTVHRLDSAQPDLTVQLSGRGIARR